MASVDSFSFLLPSFLSLFFFFKLHHYSAKHRGPSRTRLSVTLQVKKYCYQEETKQMLCSNNHTLKLIIPHLLSCIIAVNQNCNCIMTKLIIQPRCKQNGVDISSIQTRNLSLLNLQVELTCKRESCKLKKLFLLEDAQIKLVQFRVERNHTAQLIVTNTGVSIGPLFNPNVRSAHPLS